MCRVLVHLLLIFIPLLVYVRPLNAQQQFPEDPLPSTILPYLTSQFMQLDHISEAHLHTGIDITTPPNATVMCPIRFTAGYATAGWVYAMEPSTAPYGGSVTIQASEPQNGETAFFRAQHIIPASNLAIGTLVTRNTVLGTVDGRWGHLHAEIALVSFSTTKGNQFLVHPQTNAFSDVGNWNTDELPPRLDLITVHEGAIGSPSVFEVHTYDQESTYPDCKNGIYAINLYIDDVLVDALKFEHWWSKNGGPPTPDEYYYCTTDACIPPDDRCDGPNVLQYRLSWIRQPGDHIWRMDIFDAKGNFLHGDGLNGLPGTQPPAVSLGGTIANGRVALTWKITGEDIRRARIKSFDVWQAQPPSTHFDRLSTEPIAVRPGEESYSFAADAPVLADSIWYRLTADDSLGSRLVLGNTTLQAPPVADGVAAYPNPATNGFTVALSLASPHTAEVSIFDLLGRRIRLIHSGLLKRGISHIAWDGMDERGHLAPTGAYVLRVRTDNDHVFAARRFTLVR